MCWVLSLSWHSQPNVKLVTVFAAVSAQRTLWVLHRLRSEHRSDVVEIDGKSGRRKSDELPRQQALDVGRRTVQGEPVPPRLFAEDNLQPRRLGRCQANVGEGLQLADLADKFRIPTHRRRNSSSIIKLKKCWKQSTTSVLEASTQRLHREANNFNFKIQDNHFPPNPSCPRLSLSLPNIIRRIPQL